MELRLDRSGVLVADLTYCTVKSAIQLHRHHHHLSFSCHQAHTLKRASATALQHRQSCAFLATAQDNPRFSTSSDVLHHVALGPLLLRSAFGCAKEPCSADGRTVLSEMCPMNRHFLRVISTMMLFPPLSFNSSINPRPRSRVELYTTFFRHSFRRQGR